MNSDEFNKMAVDAGFEMVLCLDRNRMLASPIDHDVVQDELVAMKNLLLDEVVKKLEELKPSFKRDDGSLSSVHEDGEVFGICTAIEIIKAMK